MDGNACSFVKGLRALILFVTVGSPLPRRGVERMQNPDVIFYLFQHISFNFLKGLDGEENWLGGHAKPQESGKHKQNFLW